MARALRRPENFKAARLWRVNFGRWNFAQHLDYKILSHSNDIKFQPAQIPPIRRRSAQTPAYADEKRSRRNLFAWRPLARDRPLRRPARVLHMKFKISWLTKLRDLWLRPTQSPYLAQNSTLNVKPTHRASPLSRKIQTFPRTARRRFTRYTLHAVCHAVPACSAHHMPYVTPHVGRQNARACDKKIGKSLRQNPANGANFYFTAR